MTIKLVFSGELNVLTTYSAVVATGVAAWQVYTYVQSGPRLRLRVSANNKLAGGGYIDPKTYISFTATNTGKADTTITNIGLFAFASWRSRWRRKPEQSYIVVTGPPGGQVPHVLKPGQQFTALAKQDSDLVALSRKFLLYGLVAHSMGKDVLMRIPPIEQNDKPKDDASTE